MAAPRYIADPVPAGMLKAGQIEYWLIKVGGSGGAAAYGVVRPIPAGYQPVEAKGGGAVRLGSTVQEIDAAIAAAAAKLAVPNPQNVPSLGTSLGIIGAELTGAAGGVFGASAGAADAAAAAAAADTGAAATSSTAGSTFLSGASGKLAGAGLAGLLGATGSWQQILIRAFEALAGIALLLLGLQALTGTGTQGNPAKAARYLR